MMRRKGFTLIELLVVVAIIALLISILLPSLARARELSKRAVCAANLKGINTAIATYANDFDQSYPIPAAVQPTQDGVSVNNYKGIGTNRTTISTITSNQVSTGRCYWMLVRDNATAPKQFYCPSNADGDWATDNDPLAFYDFATAKNLSYGIQIPYGTKGRPTTERDARMPLGADRGPWGALEVSGWTSLPEPTGVNADSSPDAWRQWNSPNHGGTGDGEGQNIMYCDSHVEFEKKPCVGIGYDNIYTTWKKPGSGTATDFWLGSIMNNGYGGSMSAASATCAPASDQDSAIYP